MEEKKLLTPSMKNFLDIHTRKDELVAKDLLDAFQKSGKSYDTVMRFLKEGSRK